MNIWNTNTTLLGGFRFMQKTGTSTFNDVLYMKGDGNVGIGTSSPGARLDVFNATATEVRSMSSTTSSYANFIVDVNNVVNQRLQMVGFGSTASDNLLGIARANNGFLVKSGGLLGVGTRDSNALVFGTNEAERMRIDSSGNVGIGTNSPTEKFTVIGKRGFNSPGDTGRRCVEFFTSISASTSFTNLFSVDIGSLNQSFYYEIIVNGSDWSGHSAARVIKRGFHCPNTSYGAHTVVESSGTYASNIIYDYSLSTNTFTGRLRLDEGVVTLHCYVRLVGRINSYTIFGTE
jgi:hypothetical protein